MAKQLKIVIIGGGACGPKTAARARRLDASAQITMVQDEELISYAGCGLPYYISDVVKSRNALLVRDAAAFKKISNVDVLTATRVDRIDRSAHRIDVTALAENRQYSIDYDKLVIATGANPVVPPIKGIDFKGVHVLKRVPDADEIKVLINESASKKAVVVGAGLIGIEMVEALSARGLKVSVVEALDKVLPGILDEEISDLLADHVRSKGVTLKLGQKVVEFKGGNNRVSHVITDKETLEADVVIFAIGVRPNSKLAKEAGLEIGPFGDVVVNEYLQTSDPDIYAGGDCVANISIVTGKKAFVPLGSTANKHGHVIAANITGGSEKFAGIVSTACVKVFDFNTGRVGLGEQQAREAGFDVVTALIPNPDKPMYYPGSKEVIIKLIVDRKTRRILGGQGTGPGDVIKRIDVLATAITAGMIVDTLADLDLAYAPPYNTALDVLHHAANLVRNKLEGRTTGIRYAEVKKKIDAGHDFVLLDVRSKYESDNTWLETPQVHLLPQARLYDEMDKLDKKIETVVFCLRGGRAYQACCTLKGAGFKDVKFVEGSLTCWCADDICGEPVL
ncbi:MAG: FAD-dependent oxidoreductase [Dehalococcoidia bacterium]|jgi:NADPH-dependent 2,4-dienoyl-CoA reductase/sulfur reductase-like enzyme/rhodanese-related sulfurtransferase